MNINRLQEIRKLHSEWCDRVKSLKKTHDRIYAIAQKSICAKWRATRIGRKILKKARIARYEATLLYEEYKTLICPKDRK